MTETTTPIAASLRAAADYIEANGWWGGGADDDGARPGDGTNGPTCAGLAITGPLEFRATDFFADFIGTDSLGGVYRWNDAQPDGATVVATLRKAAASAEEQGK